MKKACVLFSSVIVMLIIVINNSKAYVYIGHFDTSNGFCEEERYGRIPVGGVGYDDKKCEEIECVMGKYYGTGCGTAVLSGRPGCRLVRGKGHHPKCCRYEQCD
ncbi:SVWC domain-containing protein [Caerostris darwini]|uniref:SVWC domain-containing protein n=1 Tax=Caerostris darwini TaxID=1538125 RepID=A0AAV4UX71_9ARAC|nr:SVWC domain-containing protein [Caerostris darwini]